MYSSGPGTLLFDVFQKSNMIKDRNTVPLRFFVFFDLRIAQGNKLLQRLLFIKASIASFARTTQLQYFCHEFRHRGLHKERYLSGAFVHEGFHFDLLHGTLRFRYHFFHEFRHRGQQEHIYFSGALLIKASIVHFARNFTPFPYRPAS